MTCKSPLQTKLLYDSMKCVYAKLPCTAEPFFLPTYNAGYSTGLNIIYFFIMKKDSAVILPSGQVSQRIVFPSFLHLSSQLQSELAQDPQAVDADTPFCCHARCSPLNCIKFGSDNPEPHKGEAEMGVSPSELAPVVQCHRCGRGKPVCIPAHHRGSSIRYGFCANRNICRNYMQKYIVILKLDSNNPKYSEEASDFSYCSLQILKGKE